VEPPVTRMANMIMMLQQLHGAIEKRIRDLPPLLVPCPCLTLILDRTEWKRLGDPDQSLLLLKYLVKKYFPNP